MQIRGEALESSHRLRITIRWLSEDVRRCNNNRRIKRHSQPGRIHCGKTIDSGFEPVWMEPMLLSAPDVASIAKIDMLLLDSLTTYNVFPSGSMLAATGPTPSVMVNGDPMIGESAPVVVST